MIKNRITKDLILQEGHSFQNANPIEVIDFIKTRKINYHIVSPADLKIFHTNKKLYLEIHAKKVLRYVIRRSFFEKLLMWYNISNYFMYKADIEVVVDILNNILKLINRTYVRITVEDNEALTITSPDYKDINDLEIIGNLSKDKIVKITRTDMFTKIDTNEIRTIYPKPNDTCGIGLSIFNSETGFHKFEVKLYLLRYICSNGSTINMDLLNEVIPHYKKDNLNRNIKTTIIKTLNSFNAKFDLIRQEFEKAPNLKASAEKMSEINKKIDYVLGYKKGNWFLREFISGFQDDKTIFDLFNFITDKAKKYKPNIRIKLEKLAGNIIFN